MNSSWKQVHPSSPGRSSSSSVVVARNVHSCTSLQRSSRTQAVAVMASNLSRNSSRCFCHAVAMSKPESLEHASVSTSASSIRESLVNRTSAPCEAHRYQLRLAATIPCGSTTSCVVVLDLSRKTIRSRWRVKTAS